MGMSKASCWYVSVSACCVLQETHVAMGVVAVEAWRPVLPTSWFSLIRCKPYAHVRLTEPLTTLSSTCGSFVGFRVSTRYLGIPFRLSAAVPLVLPTSGSKVPRGTIPVGRGYDKYRDS